jgi:hypothetical protein
MSIDYGDDFAEFAEQTSFSGTHNPVKKRWHH